MQCIPTTADITVEVLFAKIDKDGSGEIEFGEFAAWYDAFGKAVDPALKNVQDVMMRAKKQRDAGGETDMQNARRCLVTDVVNRTRRKLQGSFRKGQPRICELTEEEEDAIEHNTALPPVAEWLLQGPHTAFSAGVEASRAAAAAAGQLRRAPGVWAPRCARLPLAAEGPRDPRAAAARHLGTQLFPCLALARMLPPAASFAVLCRVCDLTLYAFRRACTQVARTPPRPRALRRWR